MLERSEQEIMCNWGQSSAPLLSICCSTFNHENYIEEALDSFLVQETDFPFEIIVRDDCSTDRTALILKSYEKKYPQIIKPIYELENQYSKGVSPFVSCLSRAVGQYIAICEGDDYWGDITKLQQQVDCLNANKDCVVTFHDAYYLSSYEHGGGKTLLSEVNKRNFTAHELITYKFMPTLSMCFRKVITEFPEEYFKVVNRDTFLISLLGGYGGAIYLPNIKPAMYREHGGGVWSGLSRHDKMIRTITTFYWMTLYYVRVDKGTIASHYALGIMSHILSLVNINKKAFMKWFLMRFFSNAHASYSKIKKIIINSLSRTT